MSFIAKEVGMYQELPKGYAWGAYDIARRIRYAHPVGIHWLFVLYDRVRYSFAQSRIEAAVNEAYAKGYAEGLSLADKISEDRLKRALDHCESQLAAGVTSKITQSQ